MLYCWQIFEEVPHAFLEQIVVRYQTKIWKCLTLYFFNYFPPTPQFVAAWMTPYLHHHQAVPGIHFADVVNHFWTVSQFKGWGEGGGKRERRGETRSDLVRLGDVFSGTHRQQDIPSCPLCYMASSCLPCRSAAETSSTFFFSPLPFEHCSFPVTYSQVWNLYPEP